MAVSQQELDFVYDALNYEQYATGNLTVRNRMAASKAIIVRVGEGDATVTQADLHFVYDALHTAQTQTWNLVRRNRLATAKEIVTRIELPVAE